MSDQGALAAKSARATAREPDSWRSDSIHHASLLRSSTFGRGARVIADVRLCHGTARARSPSGHFRLIQLAVFKQNPQSPS